MTFRIRKDYHPSKCCAEGCPSMFHADIVMNGVMLNVCINHLMDHLETTEAPDAIRMIEWQPNWNFSADLANFALKLAQRNHYERNRLDTLHSDQPEDGIAPRSSGGHLDPDAP